MAESPERPLQVSYPEHSFPSPGTISNGSVSHFDEYAANPRFQQLQTELRSLLFTEARSSANTRQHTPEAQAIVPKARSLGGLLDSIQKCVPRIPLRRLIEYFTIWTTECAPWLDMFDQDQHFGLEVPVLAQSSSPVLYALLALSARQAERHRNLKGSTQDSLTLYSEAISSLTTSLDSQQPEMALTACILCVLEMMSVSPRDWRRHAEGCAALFQATQINGFAGGLLQAVFWCYARMDLCAAIIAEGTEGTVLPIDRWVVIESPPLLPQFSADRQGIIQQAFLSKGRQIPDMHANYAVYLCARACELMAQRTRFVELEETNGCSDDIFGYLWAALWEDLQGWYTQRPPELLPVKAVASSRCDDRFPRMLFAHWAAISGNQLYHAACILMLEIMPIRANPTGDAIPKSPLWHARNVVGISLSNDHKGCLNNAIQPLYLAGRLFTHREEHKIISDLLHRIEALSGWGARWRIRDLEAIWGYRRGTFS